MSNRSLDLAREIMALVDEYPSEPLSFERREIEHKISDMVIGHTQELDNELDESYNLGLDEGIRQGRDEATDEYRMRMDELEAQIKDLQEEVEKAHADGVAEGYEGARIEYGL